MHTSVHVYLLVLTSCVVYSWTYLIPSRTFSTDQWGYWCFDDFECGRGFCQGYICHCYRGFITWRSMQSCRYEQRTKLTAFLLSFFLGIFGADWFYLSRRMTKYIIVGMMKLLVALGCIIGWPIFILKCSKNEHRFVLLINIINVLLSLTSFLWWLTDWIRILANIFLDGHGAPLQT